MTVRRWQVGGALIRHDDGLVLVGNRRRDRSLEWTPPGGVIDAGETLLVGLAREVREETGLVVTTWSHRCYTVVVEAPELEWRLSVEAWEAVAVEGTVRIDDPDGIVEEVRHAGMEEATPLLRSSVPWVADPVLDWLVGGGEQHYRFVLHGRDRRSSRIERID